MIASLGWPHFFNEHPRREMEGGFQVDHAPTRAILLKNAILSDGTLYKGGSTHFLNDASSKLPFAVINEEIEKGALYCTESSKRYFAHFLLDECVSYPLALDEGTPLTTVYTPAGAWRHVPPYEKLLGIEPKRVSSALIREAIIFEDFGLNLNKRQRYHDLRDALLKGIDVCDHPGIVILRGGFGARRLLLNELEVAEHLKTRRGFRVIDPEHMDVPDIIRACAGARAVVGVEGSGLIHGVNVLPTHGCVLALQPPKRFVGFYKNMTDRDNQYFGFVVGRPEGDDFWIDPEEVERTLDLFPTHQT